MESVCAFVQPFIETPALSHHSVLFRLLLLLLLFEIVDGRHDDREHVRDLTQTGFLEGAGIHDGSGDAWEGSGRGRLRNDRDSVPQLEGGPGGRIDAHVRHESSQDQFLRRLPPGRRRRIGGGLILLQEVVKIRPGEGTRILLDDDGFVVRGFHEIGDRTDGCRDVVRGPHAGVVLDVDDGSAEESGGIEQPFRLHHGRIGTLAPHDPLRVRVLTIDHDQGGIPQRTRLGRLARQLPEGDARHGGAMPTFALALLCFAPICRSVVSILRATILAVRMMVLMPPTRTGRITTTSASTK
jgi:hypothetical protein